MEELWRLIRAIPQGSVTSYGAIGEHLVPPTSGRAVGRWLAKCPEDVPWWRVVARSGDLPIEKRGLGLGSLQEERLRAEGVTVVDHKVDMRACALWILED